VARRRKSITELQDEWLAKPYVKRANRLVGLSLISLIALSFFVEGLAALLLVVLGFIVVLSYIGYLAFSRHRERENEE